MLRLKYKRIVTEDIPTFSPMRDTTGDSVVEDMVDGITTGPGLLPSYISFARAKLERERLEANAWRRWPSDYFTCLLD